MKSIRNFKNIDNIMIDSITKGAIIKKTIKPYYCYVG